MQQDHFAGYRKSADNKRFAVCEQSQLRGIVLIALSVPRTLCDPVKGPVIILHGGLITDEQIAPRGASRVYSSRISVNLLDTPPAHG
jgi:hypothetical protein